MGGCSLSALISLDNRPLSGGAHVVEKLTEGRPAQLARPPDRLLLLAGARQIHRAGAGQDGTNRVGQRAFISDPLRNRFGPVEIVSHHFFDPEGSRMHG